METNNKKFIKFNDHIVPKPEGIDYDLIPGKVYDLRCTRDSDGPFFEESSDFKFPTDYYLSDNDVRFIDKTIDAFNRTDKMTTGVLLSGIKGSGKTLRAKRIALETKLPIVVVDQNVYANEIEPFFAKIDTPCCLIFDEIDKYWNTRHLLTFLDGVKPTCKKLIICTCNNEKEIDEYLNDRCSRIRYKKTFDCLDREATVRVINTVIGDMEKATQARDFLFDHVSLLSYDNITVFAEEIRNNPHESFESIICDLNIANTNEVCLEKKEEDDEEDYDKCITCCEG